MKARITEWDGRLFRSRLEAKWAAFFIAWGMPYEYEPERYGPSRKGYLPDFYLPSLDLYFEIKPDCQFNHKTPEINKALKAEAFMPAPLLIVFGEPIARRYTIWYPRDNSMIVLAHCRRCHGLSYLHVSGKTISACWKDADEGGNGWGELGKHFCGDHNRWPTIDPDDALSLAYENGRKQWFLF